MLAAFSCSLSSSFSLRCHRHKHSKQKKITMVGWESRGTKCCPRGRPNSHAKHREGLRRSHASLNNTARVGSASLCASCTTLSFSCYRVLSRSWITTNCCYFWVFQYSKIHSADRCLTSSTVSNSLSLLLEERRRSLAEVSKLALYVLLGRGSKGLHPQ